MNNNIAAVVGTAVDIAAETADIAADTDNNTAAEGQHYIAAGQDNYSYSDIDTDWYSDWAPALWDITVE